MEPDLSGSQDVAWPAFRYEQEDLEARSLEPVIFEREYYSLNHLYCGAETLRRYADLPEERPVPWAIQAVMRYHDAPADADEISEEISKGARKLVNSEMPLLFPIDDARGKVLRRWGMKDVHEIGAIFHYARALYHRRWGKDAPAERRGTIAIPDKSDLGKLLDFDRKAYALKLLALPEKYQPVYVSMHWRDFERGCHLPYLESGLPMICAGHPHDPLFYERLYDTFRHFKYSCSNEISTSFSLSVLSGCHFFFLDGGDVTIQRTGQDLYEGREPTLDRPVKTHCRLVSPFPPREEDREQQQYLAKRYSGEHRVREPAFFREKWLEGRDALSARLLASDFSFEGQKQFRLFAHWLPWGMDRDGWSDQQSGLEVPFRIGFDRVEIGLQFPPAVPQEKRRHFSVLVDGKQAPENSIEREGDGVVVSIPIGENPGRREVIFNGPPEVRLEAETRKRSFRVVWIRWIPRESPGPGKREFMKRALGKCRGLFARRRQERP